MHLRGILMLNRIAFLPLLVLLLGQGCATSTPKQPEGTGSQKSQLGAASIGEPAPAAAVASRVYRDPATGEFTTPANEVKTLSAPVSIREATSTAPTSTMRETAVEGGGVKLDLQGRFRNFASATKDFEGKISVHCNEKPDYELHEGQALEK